MIFGIIALLIGISITPSVAVDTVKKPTMPISNGKTLYVGGTGEGNYTTIQDAIDDASDGDTVFVFDEGSPYYENIVVKKSINLIGEDKETTIIDGGEIEDAIYISADWVNISEFTIQNSGGIGYIAGSGIDICSNYNTITSNIISNNDYGISLHEDSNTIRCNTITLNNYSGIHFYKSDHNTIMGNNISSHNGDGIDIWFSSSNTIVDNTISENYISLFHSNNNKISRNNIISNEYYGIDLQSSNLNTISDNKISNSEISGIFLLNSEFNNIKGNNISNNKDGIILDFASFNIILKNNFIDNERDAFFTNSKNIWILNYWDSPQVFPKIIIGEINIVIPWLFTFWLIYIYTPWYNIDWRPALKPYNIEGVI